MPTTGRPTEGGRRIAFQSDEPSDVTPSAFGARSGATLNVVDVDGGTAAPNIYVRYPEWSPKGDLVVYERGELRGNVWTLQLPQR